MPDIKDSIIHTIDDFEPGDVIEFIHPASKGSQSGKFGVGKLVRVIIRRTGDSHTDIELETAGGKVIITQKNIRWNRTMYHKNKNKGSEKKCNYQKTLSMLS